MGVFKKKPDPISDRSRALNAEIAALEAQIRDLNARSQKTETKSQGRAALPGARGGAPPEAASSEPVFEELNQTPKGENSEEHDPAAHFNDLGVRKYDLLAAWRRLQNHFRGPPTNNPKLVNYLAAGSIQGLRPLRYEKRVARNRFLALFVLFTLILAGLIKFFASRR